MRWRSQVSDRLPVPLSARRRSECWLYSVGVFRWDWAVIVPRMEHGTMYVSFGKQGRVDGVTVGSD